MTGRLRSAERGQAMVLTAVTVAALLGMAALVLDAGSWFRAQRKTQAVADAAALAGAQALPDTAAAKSLALAYASRNGGGVAADEVTFQTTVLPNDTIRVHAERQADGFFARLFGVTSFDVGAVAKARSGLPEAARYVAPITVNRLHPALQCEPPPCSGATEIELANLHRPGGGDAAGNFSLIDLRPDGKGSAGESQLAEWMVKGYDELMPLGIYESVPSAMFNGDNFRDAIESMIGKEVLLPVYAPPISRGGSNAQFRIVGWVGFRISGVVGGGDAAKVQGEFTRFIAQGLMAEGGSSGQDFGVRVVTLIE